MVTDHTRHVVANDLTRQGDPESPRRVTTAPPSAATLELNVPVDPGIADQRDALDGIRRKDTEMKDLRDTTAAAALGWHEATPGSGVHVLRDGENVFGRLELSGVTANGTTASGSWTIIRGRDRGIHVRARSGRLIGSTRQSQWTGRATFVLASGATYEWRPANLLRTRWAFHDESASNTVNIEPARGPGRSIVGVKLGPGDDAVDLDILVLLARYLTVVSASDNGIAAAAAVVGS